MQNKKIPFILGIISILLITVSVFGYIRFKERNNSFETNNYVTYKNRNYELKSNLTTVLLFGVDKDSSYVLENDSTFNVRNNEQSDFILLIVIDNNTKETKFIGINRDSMFDTSKITDFYDYPYSQMALAHTYGSGGSDSAVNLMKAVSSLFGNYISISNYIKMPYDIVPTITDVVGGVEVEVLQDMTNADERLVEGEKVLLDGELAIKYVRSRMGLEDSTNISRMDRQTQFIKEFLKKYRMLDDISLEDANKISGLLHTNLSISFMQRMLDETDFDKIEYYSLKGRSTKGEDFLEFNVDKDFAEDLVFEIFYDLAD